MKFMNISIKVDEINKCIIFFTTRMSPLRRMIRSSIVLIRKIFLQCNSDVNFILISLFFIDAYIASVVALFYCQALSCASNEFLNSFFTLPAYYQAICRQIYSWKFDHSFSLKFNIMMT